MSKYINVARSQSFSSDVDRQLKGFCNLTIIMYGLYMFIDSNSLLASAPVNKYLLHVAVKGIMHARIACTPVVYYVAEK